MTHDSNCHPPSFAAIPPMPICSSLDRSWFNSPENDNFAILLVDDNPNNLSVLSSTLKRSGYKIRVALDGESAIAQAMADPPDLILLDIHMPGMDGLETCVQLKRNVQTQDIPVIFITAAIDIEYKVQGLSVGAVDYITKPFQYEEVLARVKVHLELRFLNRKVQAQALALQQANQELQRIAHLDGLTTIANRRCFDGYLEKEWKRGMREERPLSLILCDLDYFKAYNDFYGHQAGDECLLTVAKVLEANLKRPADLVARYGGEEFAIIMPSTPAQGAMHIGEQIRKAVQQLQIQHCYSQVSQYLTLSVGVSSQIPTAQHRIQSLIHGADKALYMAKKQGRNRIFLYADHDESSS